jgi:Sec-independent protein translocase protein TatA
MTTSIEREKHAEDEEAEAEQEGARRARPAHREGALQEEGLSVTPANIFGKLGAVGAVVFVLWSGMEKMDGRMQALATTVTDVRGEVRELRAELAAERRQNERLAVDVRTLQESCEVRP